jgi:transcription-repair coupling factor (superfamily II helicase)
LFGDEIESIRCFDIQHQKSFKDELESVEISPAFLSLSDKQFENISQQINDSQSSNFIKDIHSLGFWFLDELSQSYITKETYISQKAKDELDEVYTIPEQKITKNSLAKLSMFAQTTTTKTIIPNNIEELITLHKNKKVVIISNSRAKLERYKLQNRGFDYIYQPYIINLLCDNELIISVNHQYTQRKKHKIKIILDELKPGELVVHEIHGVGKFDKIDTIKESNSTKDYVVLIYQNNDKLLIPMENIDTIDRYITNSGDMGMLDKLGKRSFAKLKEKVREKLFDIASSIINTAAKRELTKGIYIDTSGAELNKFQTLAMFEYTDGQKQAIEDIFADISSYKVMDRVLSGDVGFGKTEVAINAMVACAINGFQSILIAPTTILSSQHYRTFEERFASKGFKIERLDGKSTTKQKNIVKQKLQNGELDMVVGTHSLLNTKFKNLALVVLDEEHKFGVKQKEKLKLLGENIHILSMSATPIPRTLNQALSKVKSISVLPHPPKDRLPVRTYIKEFDEKAIKEIILREKRRAGQVFYIYNNIKTINFKKQFLEELIVGINVQVIHSKVPQNQNQKILEDFTQGKIDILLGTTIVESGLHIPNANTMIVDGACRFGIADLHQLRGRVGRSHHEGFCYFFVTDKNSITQDANKRLTALQSNSYLGSGQALAYQDLQIRGGGNILGTAQSGHIKHIGYSLYLKMLEEALNTLSHQENKTTKNNTPINIQLNITAYISSDTVNSDRVRLELYRRLGQCVDVDEVYDIYEEIEDRFGQTDIYTKQFIDLITIKIKAKNKNIKQILNYEKNITIVFNDDKQHKLVSMSKDDKDILNCVLKHL